MLTAVSGSGVDCGEDGGASCTGVAVAGSDGSRNRDDGGDEGDVDDGGVDAGD